MPRLFKLSILSIRLLFHNFYFILCLIYYQFINIFKKYRTLIILYLFLFIQALLILFQPALQPPLPQLLPREEYQKEVQKSLQTKPLNTYQISAEIDQLKQEVEKYSKGGTMIAKHRDALINLALLNLALNNREKFELHLKTAREIDPNWKGFVSGNTNGEPQ